jgi:hypothetical protein
MKWSLYAILPLMLIGCATTMQIRPLSQEELRALGPNEGVVVGSLIIKGGKDLLGRTKWILDADDTDKAGFDYSIPADRGGDEEVFVFKFPAGHYGFSRLHQAGFSTDERKTHVEFQVQPGTISYIGRLVVEFPKDTFISVFTRIKFSVEDAKEATVPVADKKYNIQLNEVATNLMTGPRGPSYQENLMGGFNPGEWTLGNSKEDQNQRIIEFVRPGEKIDNWTELLTMQTLRKPANPEPIAAMVARIHADDEKSCPNGFMKNVIEQGGPTNTEEASIIYEWQFINCPPNADQHEVAKIIYGKFNIFRLAYVAKTKKLAPEKREQWIKELKEATIIIDK